MRFKNALYYSAISTFLIISLILGYYVFVNTVLANSILPNVWVNSSDVSFSSEEELREKIQVQALNNLPEKVNIAFENEHLSINTSELGFSVDTYKLVNYGKGGNLLKVLEDGLNIIKGVKVDVDYKIDTNLLLEKLRIVNSSNSGIIDSNYVCVKGEYPLTSLQYKLLSDDLINSLKTSSEYNLYLDNYLVDSFEKKIYAGCSKYFSEVSKIQRNVIDKLTLGDLSIEDLFELKNENESPVWKIKDSQILADKIREYKKVKDVNSQDGEYEIVNNQIYLYKPYTQGISVDEESTIISIYSWLNSQNLDSDPIIYKKVDPNIVSLGLPILDFTQRIGEGKTRIELIRNGFENFVIAYTMFGLDEINKTVIAPGEEFSYIKAISPQNNGTTKSGRPIAGGICNSTTTIFRAVLESGLQVTDRSYHAFYVPSYEWGYPVNIVDAAYFTNPTVDFKFKNDSDYPILLKVNYSKDNDYQYNTVEILSSSKATKRNVELSNWKVWDKYSSTNFKGSFDRTVSVNGQVLFKDNFYSHYL